MAIERYSRSVSLADVIDRILDKGLVIDAWIAVSVIGIELITIEARVIVASVETYTKYAQLLGFVGPVAGGLRQPTERKSLGEGLADVSQGLGKSTKNLQQGLSGLPLVGGQGESETEEKAAKPKSKGRSKARSKSKK